MPHSPDNYNLLIQKLDAFIRKHYLNQFIRGLIYSLAIIIALFILINVIEYYSYLAPLARKILFYGSLLITFGILYRLVLLPLFHFYKLGQLISHEMAAKIIGEHFADVKDKLLNILQLKKQLESNTAKDLIEASIDQKVEALKPVPFSLAINLGQNKKYLRYLLLPLMVLLVIVFASPNIIRDGSTRLFYNNIYFEKPAPFTFEVTNEKLKVVQYEDLDLTINIKGETLPENVFVKQEGNANKMNRKSASSHTYKFSNLQQSQKFVLTAAGFDSKPYEIEVIPKPMIVNFEVSLDYPEYTGKKDEVLKNMGDLTLPQGTKARWEFNTKSTGTVTVDFGNEQSEADRKGEQLFSSSKTLMESSYYTLKVSSAQLENADSISYSITVIPDNHPAISVQPMEDTINRNYLYFLGEISDDYGLTKLQLKYKIETGAKSDYQFIPVTFEKRSRYSQFSHFWDLKELGLKPGDKITYYFEVWDNDAIHGSKSSKSTALQFELPSIEQLEEETEKSSKNIKENLESSVEKAQEIKKEIQELQDKMIQKKSLNWEDKKAIEDLLQKQNELKEEVKNLKDELSNNLSKQHEFKDVNKDIAQKQQKLQELFNEILSDEMKELFEKMESLLEQMNKEQIMENLQDFKFTEEQLEQELDRMLALFKQLEFEQKLTETISELEKLAKEQKDLSEETKNDSKSKEDLAKEQEDINKKFDKIQEKMDDLSKIKEELGEQDPLSEEQKKAEDVKEDLSKSSENIQQNKNKKASESQKSASDKMQKMSESLSQMMNQMQMEQMELDLKAIRQLLENLITLSFDQEDLMNQFNLANINDPRYVPLIQEQYKIKDDAVMVKDSLYALSKRVFQIQSFINEEIKEINRNLEKSIDNLEERRKGDASVNQQYVMTGFNNLALMLSETMDAMQQQMASQMPGSQQCQKPGKGKPSPKLGQLQDQMNEQLSKMQEQMKQGQGGQKPGGKEGMSKELAQMAAKQAAIRQALKEMNDSENSDGSLGDLQKLMDEMDKTETELVNKKMTEQMMMRQKEIHTRLLEAEEALRNREVDKERKSQTADEIAKKMPPSLEEYLKNREAEIQLYKTVPPSLKPYYKQLIETYFKNISF